MRPRRRREVREQGTGDRRQGGVDTDFRRGNLRVAHRREAGKQETQENRIGSGERIEKGVGLFGGEDAAGGLAGAVQKASRLIAEGHAVRQAHFRHPFGEIRINWAN